MKEFFLTKYEIFIYYAIDFEIIKLTKKELILEDKSSNLFDGEIEFEKM